MDAATQMAADGLQAFGMIGTVLWTMLRIGAVIWVERESQKAIVIGKKGSRMRDVGSRARQGIAELLGKKIFLDLHVKVLKDWQRDPRYLGRLGF